MDANVAEAVSRCLQRDGTLGPGGGITDGFAIYDQIQRMRRQGTHVTTRGVGLVASMAADL